MIKPEHISREELLQLLSSEGESESTRAMGEHLHQCAACREALDALSARSEIWKKTPELLRGKPDTDIHKDFDSVADTNEHLPEVSRDASGKEFQYPIDALLDPPRHPEMLGRIGKYDIEREVGRGGMGIVFKAHDSELNRPLAIKVLAPHLASHGTAKRRFAQEAQAAAGVLHPNVIAVYDVCNEGKVPYMVMPYVAGPSLQKLIEQQGPLSEIEVVRVALQIAAGLTPAHAQGLVHRDVKPANILVEQGVNRVIITDFGLARAEDDASLTRTGWLTGTPNYMSPEQARGERLDQRSDLFSLGCLIYFLATGRLPFRADSPLGVLSRIQNEEPTPVRQVNNQISQTLAEVIEVLLRKDPQQRFQSAAELHGLLERHLAYLHQPDISKPPQVIAAPPRSNRWKVVAVGVLAIALLAAVVGGLVNKRGEGPSSNAPLLVQEESDEPSREEPRPSIDPQPQNQELKNANAAESVANAEDDETAKDLGRVYRMPGGQPTGGQRYFNEGYRLLQKKKFDDAISQFRKSEKYESWAASSNYNIACAWALQDEKEKAFEHLDRAVSLGFVDLEHFTDDADLQSLRSDDRYTRLIENLKALDKIEQLLSQARRQINNSDFAAAEKSCRQVLERDPNQAEAQFLTGYTLHMQGKIDEALPWHQRAAQSKTRAALGNYNVACVHALRSESDLAFEFLDKAIEAGLANQISLGRVEDDPDLENIRDDARYKAIIGELEDLRNWYSGSYFRVPTDSEGTPNWNDGSILVGDPDRVSGTWESRLVGDKVYLSITHSGGATGWEWGYSTTFAPDDFAPTVNRDSTEFRLTRKYGELKFEGKFDGRKGKGKFHFEGDEKFRKWVADQGLDDLPKVVLFRLFMSRQKEAGIVENLKSNLKSFQGLKLDDETRVALAVYGVEASLVKKYLTAKLDPKEHLVFLVWRVQPSLIEGYREANLSLEENKEAINSRVPANLLKSYKSEGFDTRRYLQFARVRVPAVVLTEYQSAGFNPEEYQSFVYRRIPVKLLKGYREAGYDLKKFERYVVDRVQPKLLAAYESAGLLNDDYHFLLRRNVPTKLILDYRESGYEPLEYQFFLKNQIPVALLKQYEDAGLNLNEYKEAILRRMPPEKAKEFLNKRKAADERHLS